MSDEHDHPPGEGPVAFDRQAGFSGVFNTVGEGSLGGKAQGLLFVRDGVLGRLDRNRFPGISVGIPSATVLATDVFDAFMDRNHLRDLPFEEWRDDQIALAFQKGDLPAEIVGDLRALISKIHAPLAIRSSSLFEDALHRPFAGVYATKMVPNNQPDVTGRFHVLVEAVKFVWASTYFKQARGYIRTTGHPLADEKMAVVIQEVVGQRHGERFYPDIAGVARSYNYYRSGHAQPRDGIVNLALGLGKTIVDGGVSWSYSPAYPRSNPPFKSARDMLRQTQTEFWAVNMGKPPAHDPIHEAEYMVTGSLEDAEYDGTLRCLVSTWKPEDDRMVMGLHARGPRVLTFAPILGLDDIPLNGLIRNLLEHCREVVGNDVEMEFAMTLDPDHGLPARFGVLQVRPMLVAEEGPPLAVEDLAGPGILVASETVLGHGAIDGIRDVVYLKVADFGEREAWVIAAELEKINHRLLEAERPYLLIVWGRLGTSDPAYGIPAEWWQIAGARVIVEVSRPDMDLASSQGSHFFHNVIGSQIGYFGVPYAGSQRIDWEWLAARPAVTESDFVRHVALEAPLQVRIDGRSGRGRIVR